MRIGVVTDTHVGERLPALPGEVLTALAGVDLIIHCGDLTVPGVLDDLGRVAPVVAVRGNHDDDAGHTGLPVARVLRVGGRRVGITHGTRPDPVELAGGLVSLALRRTALLGFHRAVRRRFGAVDAVVMGHVHMPVACVRDGALLFSPGAVYVPECDPWFDWSTARGRAYRRFRALAPPEALVPAVGILEVTPAGVGARRIPLREPLRTRGAGSAPGAPAVVG
jgi:putative phosphoesterase